MISNEAAELGRTFVAGDMSISDYKKVLDCLLQPVLHSVRQEWILCVPTDFRLVSCQERLPRLKRLIFFSSMSVLYLSVLLWKATSSLPSLLEDKQFHVFEKGKAHLISLVSSVGSLPNIPAICGKDIL